MYRENFKVGYPGKNWCASLETPGNYRGTLYPCSPPVVGHTVMLVCALRCLAPDVGEILNARHFHFSEHHGIRFLKFQVYPFIFWTKKGMVSSSKTLLAATPGEGSSEGEHGEVWWRLGTNCGDLGPVSRGIWVSLGIWGRIGWTWEEEGGERGLRKIKSGAH